MNGEGVDRSERLKSVLFYSYSRHCNIYLVPQSLLWLSYTFWTKITVKSKWTPGTCGSALLAGSYMVLVQMQKNTTSASTASPFSKLSSILATMLPLSSPGGSGCKCASHHTYIQVYWKICFPMENWKSEQNSNVPQRKALLHTICKNCSFLGYAIHI